MLPISRFSNILVDYVSAALCLYSGEYEQAVYFADRVRSMRECNDVLFIKARALTLLKRYKDADTVNIELVKCLDGEFDAKTYYEVALLNETQLGDPGLGIMQSVVKYRPEYGNSIIKLRVFMKKYNIDLIAIPNKEIDSYSYQIDFGRSNRYKPCFRAYTELWENPKRAMKRLHLSAPEGRKVDKAVMFSAVPRYKTSRIVRKNFYKETGPTTYCDYIVLKTSEA
jgi:hypothetical protein